MARLVKIFREFRSSCSYPRLRRIPTWAVVAITHFCGPLCRLRGPLGYGYKEWRNIDLTADPPSKALGDHGRSPRSI
jgi:hypothetical protein